jgi:hypothetical protein
MAPPYPELAERFEGLAAAVRALPPGGREAALAKLAGEARQSVATIERARLEELALWHTDFFYRTLNRVSFVDDASFAVAGALGSAVRSVLGDAGVGIAYLVDNALPHDRIVPAEPFFNSLGFVVASPELFAIKLAHHDGIVVQDALGDHLPRYAEEATMVAARLFDMAIAKGLPIAWLSGACDFEVYVHLAQRLERTSYVGVFRNEAPEEGSRVHVFRRGGKSVPIDPNY